MFNFEFFMELFGYIGTALVVVSMLMTSVVKLRVLNICGSVISLVYALIGGAYPIVLMNGALIVINLFQLIRVRPTKAALRYLRADMGDASVAFFVELYRRDIVEYFPSNLGAVEESDEAHLAFCGGELAGIVIGRRRGDEFKILIDYATPRYRDLTVSGFLYGYLKESGINTLHASESGHYFAKMGFTAHRKNLFNGGNYGT